MLEIARPIEEMVACNLCGSRRSRLRFPDTRTLATASEGWQAFLCTHGGYGVHGPVVQCLDCGLLFVSPRPSRQTILQSYSATEDPVYDAERAARRLTFRRHLRKMQRIVGDPKQRSLLDVGAHIGVFVEEAGLAGWRAHGLEPSRWAVNVGRQRGINLERGFLTDRLFPDESFDVVTLWDVVEHLTDPAAEIARCWNLLRDGGWLVIHTMDSGSLTARVLGRRWPWLMEMHLYYFDRKTLRELVEKARFEHIKTDSVLRILSLGYLASRVQAFFPSLGALPLKVVSALGMKTAPVPVSFGDLVTCYARKPLSHASLKMRRSRTASKD